MRCLTFDPGRNVGNYAFSWLVDGTVECYGTVVPLLSLQHPDFSECADDFICRMQLLFRSLGLAESDVVLAERFSDRGGGSKGTTGEFINIQIGLLKAALGSHPLELVMPSTWKGWLARTYATGNETATQRTSARSMHEHLRWRFPETHPIEKIDQMTIHEGDAVAMGLWRYETSADDRYGSIDNLFDHHTIRVTC